MKPTPSVTPTPSPTLEASASASGLTRVSVTPTAAIDIVEPAALATDGRVVWAMTGTGRAVRIDPATDQTAISVQLGATTDHFGGIAVDSNGIWVTDWDTKTLFRVDATSLDVVARIPGGVARAGSSRSESPSGWPMRRVGPFSGSILQRTKLSHRSRLDRPAGQGRAGLRAASAASGSEYRTIHGGPN